MTGKENYKSPEVMECPQNGKSFNSKANDIWCLGGCLFRMIFGIEPWIHAQKGDESFDLIMDGKLSQLLKFWNKQDLVDEDLMELFDGFFRSEHDRITIEQIKESKWYKDEEKETNTMQ